MSLGGGSGTGQWLGGASGVLTPFCSPDLGCGYSWFVYTKVSTFLCSLSHFTILKKFNLKATVDIITFPYWFVSFNFLHLHCTLLLSSMFTHYSTYLNGIWTSRPMSDKTHHSSNNDCKKILEIGHTTM